MLKVVISPSQSHGASPAIWDHTVLPAIHCTVTCSFFVASPSLLSLLMGILSYNFKKHLKTFYLNLYFILHFRIYCTPYLEKTQATLAVSFLYSSLKRWPILIIFGVQPQEDSHLLLFLSALVLYCRKQCEKTF